MTAHSITGPGSVGRLDARRAWLIRVVATFAMLVATAGPSLVHAGIDTWTSNGPYGGTVTVLVVDPLTPANLYAAGFSGVFKSANGGTSWARASNGITDPSVGAIAIDPVTPTTLYAGSVFGGKVVKSTDGAATWAPLANSPTLVVALAIDPTTPATIYAGRQQAGISKSTNSGATWNPIGVATLPTGFPTFKSLVVDPVTPATIYAGETTQGVWKSVDGGATWNPSNTGFITSGTGTIIQVLALAIDPQTPSTLYAVANTSSASGLFTSSDGGGHWTLLANGNIAAYNFFIQTVSVDPTSPSTVYIGTGTGVFKSTNSGTNFSPVQTGMPSQTVTILAISPLSHATVYAGTVDGIFATTTAGGTWTAASNGLALTSVTAVAVDPLTPMTVYAGTKVSGIFKSVDSGGTWISINAGIPPTGNLGVSRPSITSLAIDPLVPTTLYAGTQFTQNIGVLKSVNGGASWTAASTGIPLFASIASLAIDPLTTSNIYAAAGNAGLYKSTDGGATWNADNAGLPVGAYITDVSIGVLSAPQVFGQSSGLPSPLAGAPVITLTLAIYSDGLWIKDDKFGERKLTVTGTESDCVKTATKAFMAIGLVATPAQIYVACISPNATIASDNSVYLSNGATISAPGGAATLTTRPTSRESLIKPAGSNVVPVLAFWASPNGDNAQATACSSTNSIVSNPFDNTEFYAAAECGVLKGTNLGQQVVLMNAGLPPNLQVNAITTSPARIALYAGTAQGGVYQYTFSAQTPTQLGITNVNGGNSPVAGIAFNVVVTAQAADSSPQSVAAITTVQLSVTAGTGSLGGTTSCQIPAGATNCTVTGLTYGVVETGVVLTATRTAGDTLTAGNSVPFDVVAVGPPNFVNAASRKVHGSAGTFDLPLGP